MNEETTVSVLGADQLEDQGRSTHLTSIWAFVGNQAVGLLVKPDGCYQVTRYNSETGAYQRLLEGNLQKDVSEEDDGDEDEGFGGGDYVGGDGKF